jgi:DNA-binding LytR/AlgR family response regulator
MTSASHGPAGPTALIAEDEPLLAAHLRSELGRIWPELQVIAQVGDGDTALRQALALRPQVCFLDIRMPGQSGLDVARALAEDWPEGDEQAFPLLVYVTAYDQYAVQAFEQQAMDYLLKPVEPRRLEACVQRLRERLSHRLRPPGATVGATSGAVSDPPAIAGIQDAMAQLRALMSSLPTPREGASAMSAPSERLSVVQAQIGSTIHMLPIDEVLYFEAADKYLRVVTAEREHLIRTSIRELLPRLDGVKFWQVHRGLIVQMSRVRSAERDESGRITLRLRDRTESLPVSRLYAHLFKGM